MITHNQLCSYCNSIEVGDEYIYNTMKTIFIKCEGKRLSRLLSFTKRDNEIRGMNVSWMSAG
jgi:hypothetical protein